MKIDYNSIEIDFDTKDYPDFADAYATYAEYEDGTELTDEELEDISPDLIHGLIFDRL
jgi:fructose-1,6-bisphosphatase